MTLCPCPYDNTDDDVRLLTSRPLGIKLFRSLSTVLKTIGGGGGATAPTLAPLDRYPMNRKCLVKYLVYQATVTTDDNRPSQTYVGLTENTFKTRFNNPKASFKSYQKRNSTELIKYFWHLSLVFTSDISISKMTKDKFSSEVYEDKAGRIFF